MELTVERGRPSEIETDALIVPVASGSNGSIWATAVADADSRLLGELAQLTAEAKFTGRAASTLVVPTLGSLPARRVILTGVGPIDDLGQDALVRAAGAAVRAARDAGARQLTVALPDATWGIAPPMALEALATGALLGLYRFDEYRGSASPEAANDRTVASIQFAGSELSDADSQRSIRRAKATANGVTLARDLGNEPASTLTPEAFASRAREVAETSGLDIEILGPDELAAIGAEATLAVGGGSVNGPRLIRLRYRPAGVSTDERVTGLVGKAITFDTGGYSIKPYEGMLHMKGDMAGGAAVLGAMSALRDLECPAPVEGTICVAENMISGTAFRPGDVLRGMNG
ncbi:MAG: leucyl aminopeptidase family protein, partial [Thermomicrobiales bacterium]